MKLFHCGFSLTSTPASHRFFFATLALILTGVAAGLRAREAPLTPVSDAELSQDFGAILNSPGRIVFLGDSITHGGHYITMLETYFQQEQRDVDDLEWINLGLPSETCSGLSEPSHPFPRPNVHERLDRALEKMDPDVLVFCYGMNDGIYHPFDEDRFRAFQAGITSVVEKAKKTGAYVILLTPPAFDPLPMKRQGKLVPADGEEFAWHSIYEDYASVTQRYADWILTQRPTVDMVIDIHSPIVLNLEARRQTDPDYTMSNDGVHLNEEGHRIIANAILEAWEKPGRSLDPGLYAQLSARQEIMHAAWLSHVGYLRPEVEPGLPMDEARLAAQRMTGAIQTLVSNAPQKARFQRLDGRVAALREAIQAARRRLGNQFVRLLFPPEEAPEALSNGQDLSNWEGDERYWSMEADGTIRGANQEPVPSSTYLFTKKPYRNFRLIFEVRQTMSPEHSTMHSAVAALGERFEDKGPNPYGFRGPLLMFCHDWGIWDAYRRNRVEPAGQQGQQGPLNELPAERKGEWNLVEFLVVDQRIQCAANGIHVFDFTDQPEMLQTSPIELQLLSNQKPQEFRFRHLYLSENPSPELITPRLVGEPAAP